MDNNAYLLVCTATGEALLIDAANEPERLAGLVGAARAAQLRTTVTTHRHYDHWQALGAVAEKFGTRQVAHPLDAPELPVPSTRRSSRATPCTVGRVPAGGHPPARAHARLDRPALPRRRRPAPVHRRLAVPGRPGEDEVAGRLRLADGRPRGARVRRRCRTRPGSTPATATTRRSGDGTPAPAGVACARLVT